MPSDINHRMRSNIVVFQHGYYQLYHGGLCVNMFKTLGRKTNKEIHFCLNNFFR